MSTEIYLEYDWKNHKELYQHGRIEIAGYTNVGKKRESKPNEDRFGISRIDINRKIYSFGVVADGMGGERDGADAAQLVIDTMPHIVSEALLTSPDPVSALRKAIVEIDERQFVGNKGKKKSGATVAAFILDQDGNYWATRMGDARVIVDGKSIFEDESVAATLVAVGDITAEQAYSLPTRNLVLGNTGGRTFIEPTSKDGPDKDIFRTLKLEEVDIHVGRISNDILACSDGLWEEIGNHEVQEKQLINSELSSIIVTSINTEEAVQQLVDKAIEYGGNDNITALLAKISKPAISDMAPTIRRAAQEPTT